MCISGRSIFAVLCSTVALCTAFAEEDVQVTEETLDAERKYLEELHYSHEDFVRI